MYSNIQKNHILTISKGIEYYTVTGLDEIHREMIRLLQIIEEIATKNNITYWIDGGSLIGVLRHDGFIPWDDDLDISMLKTDYLKLIELLDVYATEHNDAYLFYKTPQEYHVCNYFASKKVFSRTEGSAIIVPVKIDIRPVNCINNDNASVLENNKLRDITNFLLYNKSYGYASSKDVLVGDKRKFFYQYNYEYGLDEPTDSSLLVHPYFEFSNQFELKVKDVLPIKRHKFENITVPIPSNSHYILSELYGEYMKLPKLENRAPVSCKVYEKHFSESFYKDYIDRVFALKNNGFIERIINNIYLVKAVGIKEYIKCRLYE